MTRWVFVRHGESVANRDGWLSGHVDTALTEQGHRQARALAERLGNRGIGRIFTSDLARARDTAAPTAARLGLDLHQVPELRERHMGDWAHRRRAELVGTPPWRELLTWAGAPPGGESQAALAVRVLTWLASVEDADGETLVVAHGGVLRVICGLAGGLGRDEVGRLKVRNCEVFERDVDAAGWRGLLEALGDGDPATG